MPVSERGYGSAGIERSNMANEEIRELLRKKRIRHYEVAEQLGISEYTFCKYLRNELTDEKKKLVINAINDICNSEGL